MLKREFVLMLWWCRHFNHKIFISLERIADSESGYQCDCGSWVSVPYHFAIAKGQRS